MLNIDATDKIEGIASVADKVEFTCSIVDGTTVKSSEGLLSNSQTQIYLAVAATRILSLTLVNTHTSAVTVNVQKDPTDAGTLYRIIPKDLSLGIGYMLVFDGQRCTVIDASGSLVTSFGIHASNHQNGGSDEISVAGLSGLLANDQHVLDAEVLAAAGVNSGITSMTGLDDDGVPLAKVASAMNLTGANLAIGSDANGDIYYRAAGVLARLALGGANTRLFINAGATAPEWAVGVKVVTYTRDMQAVGGNVAITGAGFKPSAIIVMATGPLSFSLGFGDTGTAEWSIRFTGATLNAIETNIGTFMTIVEDAGLTKYQYANLTSFDADGCTLYWTKGGTPAAGTGYYTIMYIR